MPCSTAAHQHGEHVWPTEGVLVIERCEHFCAYCTSPTDTVHDWKYAWFLRRHVASCHTKPGCDYENVTLSKVWTGKPKGKPRKKVHKKMSADGSPMKKVTPRKTAKRAYFGGRSTAPAPKTPVRRRAGGKKRSSVTTDRMTAGGELTPDLVMGGSEAILPSTDSLLASAFEHAAVDIPGEIRVGQDQKAMQEQVIMTYNARIEDMTAELLKYGFAPTYLSNILMNQAGKVGSGILPSEPAHFESQVSTAETHGHSSPDSPQHSPTVGIRSSDYTLSMASESVGVFGQRSDSAVDFTNTKPAGGPEEHSSMDIDVEAPLAPQSAPYSPGTYSTVLPGAESPSPVYPGSQSYPFFGRDSPNFGPSSPSFVPSSPVYNPQSPVHQPQSWTVPAPDLSNVQKGHMILTDFFNNADVHSLPQSPAFTPTTAFGPDFQQAEMILDDLLDNTILQAPPSSAQSFDYGFQPLSVATAPAWNDDSNFELPQAAPSLMSSCEGNNEFHIPNFAQSPVPVVQTESFSVYKDPFVDDQGRAVSFDFGTEGFGFGDMGPDQPSFIKQKVEDFKEFDQQESGLFEDFDENEAALFEDLGPTLEELTAIPSIERDD